MVGQFKDYDGRHLMRSMCLCIMASRLTASVSPAICNNGSVNELDVIVDLLGVPSDLLTQRDLNR